MTCTVRRRFLLFASAMVAVLWATCLASISSAAINGDYNVMIGESPRYLEAILRFQRGEITASELYVIKYEESCKNPSIRLQDRNRPALLLQNTSNQDNFISSFVIDLEEPGYAFGTGDIANDGFNNMLVLQDPRSDAGVTVTANYLNGDQSKLQLNFSGLGQGKAALFRIDLDPAPMTDVMFPDYRGIILGADVGGGASMAALVSATFSMDGMPNASTPPSAFNGNITGTVSSGTLEVYLNQSRTDMFDHDGTTEIPEPATLAPMALAGLAWLARRRRAA